MKTNQIMKRPMGCFQVEQRTKDAFFNATSLLKQWNNTSVSERKLDNYFHSEKTQMFIQTIMERENLDTPKMVYVKSRASRGDSAGTWMHPMLFIDFAMWIDPEFKYDVLKFVYDQMIHFRNEAGNAYKALASAVQKVVKPEFTRAAMTDIAKAINWCVFNQHETMIRNQHGDESQQKELWELERMVASLIEDGFIRDFQGIINYLRQQWRKKHQPKIFNT